MAWDWHSSLELAEARVELDDEVLQPTSPVHAVNCAVGAACPPCSATSSPAARLRGRHSKGIRQS